MKPAFLMTAAVLLCSCAQSDDLAVYRVPKEDAAAAAPRAESGSIRWSAPRQWASAPAGGMRVASFKAGAAEVSVVALPGDAGGDLANVNRWRGQLGLGPIDESALARQSEIRATPAGKLLVVDFSAPGKGRMRAARLFAGGRTWFFKMTGPEAAVASAKASFDGFLGSLRP